MKLMLWRGDHIIDSTYTRTRALILGIRPMPWWQRLAQYLKGRHVDNS